VEKLPGRHSLHLEPTGTLVDLHASLVQARRLLVHQSNSEMQREEGKKNPRFMLKLAYGCAARQIRRTRIGWTLEEESAPTTGPGLLSWRLRRWQKKIATMAAANTTTPPTVPTAIAPTFFEPELPLSRLFCPVALGVDGLVVDVIKLRVI